MAGARIGGNIGDMEGAAGVMADTGSSATGTGSEAAGVSSRMEAEISDVASALSAHFQTLHQQLRDALNRNRERLTATDWEGQAHDEALRAEADLNTQASGFLETAQGGVEDFRTSLLTQAQGFVDAISGEYAGVMANIDAAYAGFARATRTHADNLVSVDQSFRYGG